MLLMSLFFFAGSAGASDCLKFHNQRQRFAQCMTSPIRYYKFTPPEKFTIKTRWSYIHVDTVNEAEQMFSAPLELWTSTTDDRLSWNDSLTNFSWFYVQRSRLWLPELYLSDRVYARDNVDDHHISRLLAGVFSDGRIITYLTLRDLSRCPFNNYRFPFDEQLCKITVESRYFSEISYFDDEEYCASVYPELSLSSCKMEIDAITKSGDYYTQPAGWTVLFGANDSNHVVGQDYRHFRLRRKALTPFLIWILCPVSIASVAVIGIFYFCDSGERFSFGATIIVSLLLMMINLNDNLPMTQLDMPIIHQLFLGLNISVILAMLSSRRAEVKGDGVRQRVVVQFWPITVISGHFLWICVCLLKWAFFK